MSKNVSISIVTVTLNCANTLPDCIASVSMQKYSCREHIIIDGASTDGTMEIIYSNLNNISNFKSEPDEGIYDALNKGIKMASGEIIGFLHADDVYSTNDILNKIAKAFEDPKICAIYGDLEYVSQQDKTKIIRLWKSKKFEPKDLEKGWMPPHPTLYVRRDWYSAICGFDINYRISADYLSVLKLFKHSEFNTHYIPEVLIKMRMGGESNKSLKNIIIKLKEDWRALRSCNFSLFVAIRALLWKNISKIKQYL